MDGHRNDKYKLPNYQLAADLRESMRAAIRTGGGRDNRLAFKLTRRAQIVSPDLCGMYTVRAPLARSSKLEPELTMTTDDVLAYIGPSLEKHKGCDLLDLYPGAGLWSQKLHDFLQPRSHILLEPSDDFDEYLEPLTKLPGSTYKIIKVDPSRYETYDKLIDDGHFPHQKRVAPEEARAREPNDSLLVTGAFLWDPAIPGIGFTSMSKQLMAAFSSKTATNEAFHAFGPARMLLWCTDDDFSNLLPRGMQAVGKTSVIMQKTTNVTQVVTADGYKRKGSSRAPRYKLESTVQAMTRARENGIELPAHRRWDIHDFADDVAEMSGGTGMISSAECFKYLKEQSIVHGKSTKGVVSKQIDEYWGLQRDFTANPPPPVPPIPGRKGPPPVTEEQKSLAGKRASAALIVKQRIKTDQIVDLGEEIYHLECNILGMDDGAEKEAELDKLQKMQGEFDNQEERVIMNLRTQIASELDDRLALRSPVPRLLWDQRPYEPLVMQPDEVWPANHITLGDFAPRTRPEGESGQDFEYFLDFVYGLSWVKKEPLPRVMERMQHGASELLDQVPVMRDPKRGGRLNLNNMRTRMLTEEMIMELNKAYRNWPFRDPAADHTKYFRSRSALLDKKKNR